VGAPELTRPQAETGAADAGRAGPAPEPHGRHLDATAATDGPGSHRRRYVPLLQRVAGVNAVLLILAVVVTTVVLAPSKISSFAVDKEVLVLIGLVAVGVLANVYLLRRVIGPIQALTALARRVDLTDPGKRMPGAVPRSEAGELALTFNEMLARLQAERRAATGRVLGAQEEERLRIAQELHDQVGQELTAVLLGISRIESQAPEELRREVVMIRNVVRTSLEDIRRIAIELRPEALDDLGLASALAVLSERSSEQLGLEVTERIAPDLPQLGADVELVVYRVAQEALTNVARHSGSDRAELTLTHAPGMLTLTVRDRGRGLPQADMAGTGMRGMHERAALIGARLEIRNGPGGIGCEVRLELRREVGE
jgi:two-component system, NarL family, sensor histidine kinase UhpB